MDDNEIPEWAMMAARAAWALNGPKTVEALAKIIVAHAPLAGTATMKFIQSAEEWNENHPIPAPGHMVCRAVVHTADNRMQWQWCGSWEEAGKFLDRFKT